MNDLLLYMPFNCYTTFIISLSLVLLYTFQSVDTNQNDFESDKEIIVLRKIGHEILLQSGDTTSRVLPVKKLSDNEYQLQFESRFTFQPDTLVSIVRRIVQKNELPSNYIVNVLECSSREIIYGYAIFGTEKNDIVPCSGRVQPKNCYFINLKFQKASVLNIEKKYVIMVISLLALVVVLFAASSYRRGRAKNQGLDSSIYSAKNLDGQIGRYFFSFEEQYLFIDENKIDLTYKESKILNVFVKNPNQIIDRSLLQKEVWENEGVVVGRSLDNYISKLRKKLKRDSSIEIVNIHGKGYKLQII